MKKLVVFLSLALTIAVFQFCSSSKKVQAPPKMTYSHMQATIAANCSPCHVGPQARSGHLDSYTTAKAKIDEMITNIQKNPGEKGFMPNKRPKLADSTIAVFVKWRNDGLLEN